MTQACSRVRRVLIVHNRYIYRGGEDVVVEAESELLRQHGHIVHVYSRDNDEIAALGTIRAARDAFWSSRTEIDVRALQELHRFDLIHVHNTFPLVSPSIYWVASRLRLPVVQTLHNFRLLCPQGTFLRDGVTCEDCLGRVPWKAVRYRCYRGSYAESAVLAGTLSVHGVAGTWQDRISRFVALTEFSRQKFIQGGLPGERIGVKPNFVAGAWEKPWIEGDRRGGLFVGRLSPEKGISTLLAALAIRRQQDFFVIGDGPELEAVQRADVCRVLGSREESDVMTSMREAAYLVVPSVCFEQFPRSVVEAFASGLPVIASNLGGLAEIVEDGRTGLLFDAGNPASLAERMAWADDHPQDMRRMGRNAIATYRERYSPERNYALLMSIYDDAICAGAAGDH